MFVSEDLFRKIVEHEVLDIEEELNTDHKSLTMTLQINEVVKLHNRLINNKLSPKSHRIKFSEKDWKDIVEVFESTLENETLSK